MRLGTSGYGTNRPCRLPLVWVRKLGSSCHWLRASTDLPQWKVDRLSATGQWIGEDDPLLTSTRSTGKKTNPTIGHHRGRVPRVLRMP